MKTLSICFPSYDRFEILNETVKNILQCQSDDYEIVIVDNCSPRNIEDFIVKDPRVRIEKRSKPVYGAKNMGDCILFADGKYAMVVLDKDKVDGLRLDDFIRTLSVCDDINGGYCKLNTTNDRIEISKEQDVLNYGYLSKHPSGDFYKIDILRDYIKELDKFLEKDPFSNDIYLAFCASKGKMMCYDRPLVSSMLDNISNEDTGTLTYKKSDGNLYYFPKNRIDEFLVYGKCLGDLNLSTKEKRKVIEKIYFRTLINVTLGYKNIMKNIGVCHHYGHETKNVRVPEMISNVKLLNRTFNSVDWSYVDRKCKSKIKKSLYPRIFSKTINKVKSILKR